MSLIFLRPSGLHVDLSQLQGAKSGRGKRIGLLVSGAAMGLWSAAAAHDRIVLPGGRCPGKKKF